MTLLKTAQEAVENKKGADLAILDVRELSTVTDFYLICTGTSAPHLKALAEEVELTLKKEGQRVYRKAGSPDSGWIAADYVDVVVHLFLAEAREYYALEQLWNDAPRLTL